eukprot:comp25474_c0_seq1/m.46999 comp25474_c0_seq1/g.46999  ORF comp25474_c0_seq1/g.46999 comp25474_c0_seq1/m.46999 type:complete len:331 (-) comp25474_c0_seq1:326-1318(-)
MAFRLLTPAVASACSALVQKKTQGVLYVAAQSYATKGNAFAFGVNTKPTTATAPVPEQKETTKKQKQKPEPSLEQQATVLSARLGETLSPKLLAEALTDETYEADENNTRLVLKGQLVTDLLVREHLVCRYPDMPRQTHKDVAEGLTGEGALLQAARAFGIEGVVRCKFSLEGEEIAKQRNKKVRAEVEKARAQALKEERERAAAQAFLAVVGAVYEEKGLLAARGFVADTILATLRRVDLKDTIQVSRADKMLGRLCRERDLAMPVFRIVNEAGRWTHQPTFMVAAFSDGKNLGQGVGHSVRDAIADASKAALMDMLLTEQPNAKLPSA